MYSFVTVRPCLFARVDKAPRQRHIGQTFRSCSPAFVFSHEHERIEWISARPQCDCSLNKSAAGGHSIRLPYLLAVVGAVH